MMVAYMYNSSLHKNVSRDVNENLGYETIRYDTIRLINVRAKADEMASLI